MWNPVAKEFPKLSRFLLLDSTGRIISYKKHKDPSVLRNPVSFIDGSFITGFLIPGWIRLRSFTPGFLVVFINLVPLISLPQETEIYPGIERVLVEV